MTTVHVENVVHDYDEWKRAFERFDRARRDRGVQSYRISRDADDDRRLMIDLEFECRSRAEEFIEFLHGVWRTPQSRSHLVEHSEPVILEVVEEISLGSADSFGGTLL